ncbi:MAG: hypothetical protein KDC79_00355 [Cyclobacteriaceae bacterium]|nr:hypothetical protein [Cyclobacteriaceae bacterium]
MKPIKTEGVLKSNIPHHELHFSVFAEPSARESYQRLFEIAKLNFQSVESPDELSKLLWEKA